MLSRNVENEAARTWLQRAGCPPAGLAQTELPHRPQTSGPSCAAQEATPQRGQSAEDTAGLALAATPMEPPIATCKPQTWKVLKHVCYMQNNIIGAERKQCGSMPVSVGRSKESAVKKKMLSGLRKAVRTDQLPSLSLRFYCVTQNPRNLLTSSCLQPPLCWDPVRGRGSI